MDDSCYNKIISLLLFPNRSEEKIANFLSVTNGYLWRRDSHRLVAFNLPALQGDWHYPIEDVATLEDVKNIALDERGILTFLTKNANKALSPVNESFYSHSLQTLFTPNHDVAFEIPSKELSKQLSILQRNALNQSLDMEKLTLTINVKKRSIGIKELHIEKNISLHKLEGDDVSVSFCFAFFRDLLINCNKFNKSILFKSHVPYFSVIQYDDHVLSVLTHKKD